MRRRKEPSKTISINDVARLSKVSISTVSRVINKSNSVKEKNRKKVQAIVDQLHYKPSVFAQRLATGKSNVIALIIPRYEGVFYSFYALELIRGIGTLAAILKMDLLLHLADSRSNFNLRGIGGAIFADVISNRKQLEEALNDNLPSIVINNYVEDLAVNCIAIDNRGGAVSAVEYLIGLGHKKIAHIAGDLITQAAVERLEGYKKALASHNIPVREDYIVKTDYSLEQAWQASQGLLSLPDRPTAIFVSSDSMALEVMSVAKEHNIRIPEELSLIGFDDNPAGLYGPVSLTTVRQPLVKMAQDAVKELNTIMNMGVRSPVKKIYLSTELVVRESCQPVGLSQG